MERRSLDTLSAAWAEIMGIPAPEHAATANPDLVEFAKTAFGGKNADRIVIYNPDAVGQWICEKYPEYIAEITGRTQLALPLESPMPSVTPVCFGTMYTGAQPAVHGIMEYIKKPITIDTIFDALIRAGKKPVLLSAKGHSIGVIFNGTKTEHFIPKDMTEVNAKAVQLLLEDQYDVYIIYNGNYDMRLHKFGPEDPRTLGELRINAHMFGLIQEIIRTNWKHHRTLLGFCPDHGCHLGGPNLDPGEVGSHGLDIPEDLEILHYYAALGGEEEA